ncbi:MAG TPA: rod shape-determining protein MreD [Atopostipes sp.]|nr:rod shape-determining protein MreD [Atopostipes sp.]
MHHWRKNLTVILLLFSSVLIDGFIQSAWTSSLQTSIGLIVPRTILLMFIILSFHFEPNFILINAAIFGFIMDTYYLGFIGIYMASLVLMVYLTYHLKRLIRPNVLSYTLISVLGITLVEVIVFGIMRILGITTLSFQLFLVSRLSATLLFNGIVMLVFSFFIDRLVANIADES